jgi:hypothetical protein
MPTKVNLVAEGSFAMPPICVSCGSPAGSETIKSGGSDFSGKHYITLSFPICEACAEAQKTVKWPRRWGHLLGLVVGFVVGMGAARLGYIVVASDWWALLGIAITILGTVLGARVATRRMSDDLKERSAALQSAVVFKKYKATGLGRKYGHATVEFANASFAGMFCAANPIIAMPSEGFVPPMAEEPRTTLEAEVPPAGWYEDPSGVHEKRWWDGSSWTEHVEDAGVPGVDA